MAAPQNNQVREKILLAAAKLLESKTMREVSLTDIANEVGIAKGSIYHYYKNKNDLYKEVVEKYLEDLYLKLQLWLEDENKDRATSRMVQYFFAYGLSDPSRKLRFHIIAEAANGNDSLRKSVIKKYESFKRILEKRLKESGLDSEECGYKAWLLITVLDGIILQSIIKNDNFNEENFIKRFVASTDM